MFIPSKGSSVQFRQFNHSVMSNSLWSHGQKNLVGYSPWGCKTVRYNLRTKWKQILNESVNKKSTKLKPGSKLSSVQFSSVAQSCPTLCNPMNCSMPGLPIHHQLLKLTRVGDAIQPSHPLLSLSPPAHNLSQHQGLFQRVSSSHQVAKYWSFSFSISPSNEYSALISFVNHDI